MDEPLRPVPVPDPDSIGYWEALSRGTLAVCRCNACRTWMHPPQETCRSCGAATTFEPVSGRGTIFSFIVVRHQSIPGLVPPYVVGVIEMEEQPEVRLTGIIEAAPAEVAIGQPVRAVISPPSATGLSQPTWELFR